MRIGIGQPTPLRGNVQIERLAVEQGIDCLKNRAFSYSVVSNETAELVVTDERDVVVTAIRLYVSEEDSDNHVQLACLFSMQNHTS